MLPEAVIGVIHTIIDVLADLKGIDQATQADLHARLASQDAADEPVPVDVTGSGGVTMPAASAGSPT